jgi:hypothetical protein
MKKKLAIGAALAIVFVLVGIPCYRYVNYTCCAPPPIQAQPARQGDLTLLPPAERTQRGP